MAKSDRPKSVFGHVEPDQVLSRSEDFGDDGESSDFFSDALKVSSFQAASFLDSGVRAFTGADEISADASTPEVIEFSGDLADDVPARQAFILRGPRGVRRIAASS